jgi:hypothetical protein
MKKISVIGATLVAAAVLCAAPISLHQGVSLSVDKAQARIGRPLTPGSIAGVNRRMNRRAGYYGQGGYRHYGHGGHTAAEGAVTCKAAAKMDFPNDRKARRASRHECKQAWKAQKKA